jgi:hypothetical protein
MTPARAQIVHAGDLMPPKQERVQMLRTRNTQRNAPADVRKQSSICVITMQDGAAQRQTLRNGKRCAKAANATHPQAVGGLEARKAALEEIAALRERARGEQVEDHAVRHRKLALDLLWAVPDDLRRLLGTLEPARARAAVGSLRSKPTPD